MATLTASIQQLYIAYYNRPADASGLKFWLDSLAKGEPLSTISKQFAAAPEYKARYDGKSPEEVVKTVYQNLFNRLPDPGGLDFWSKGLEKGTYTVDNIVADVAASALQDPVKGPDTVILQNKVSEATTYTQRVIDGLPVLDPNDTSGLVGFDASRFWGFEHFRFNAGGSVLKVLDFQTVSTGGDLAITARGYIPALEGTVVDGGTKAATTVYAGALHVTVDSNGATVTAGAKSLDLTVAAKTGAASGGVTAILHGDVQSASVTLKNGVNTDRSLSIAAVEITTGGDVADAVNGTGPYVALAKLASLTVSGDGVAQISNSAAGKLTYVDASALASVDSAGAFGTGLVYSSINGLAETIKLGAGIDHLTLSSSTYQGIGATGMDTVTGLTLRLASGSLALAANSDTIDIGGGALHAVKWKPNAALTDLDLIMKDAAAADAADTAHDAVVFQFRNNTYVFMDTVGDGRLTEGDTVVRLTGNIDLDTLVIALA